MLCLIVAILSFSSFRGVYAYRQLARAISRRSMELPPAANLTAHVSKLKFKLREANPADEFIGLSDAEFGLLREQFEVGLTSVDHAFRSYQDVLAASESGDPYIGDKRLEWETVREIKQCLCRIKELKDSHDWVLNPVQDSALTEEVERLSDLTGKLPNFLQSKMQAFREEVRGLYRTWIFLTWTTTILTGIILALLVRLFYVWVFRPLRILVNGSRCVAAGNFDHRIQLRTHDEVAELAAAMNEMTERFQQIRDDLDEQVAQRTREVVRSEQLASVGFLAAGVAHEINNPLASIAWAAESLESRVHDTLNSTDDEMDEELSGEIDVMRKYLQRIQDEAFRCKGITERLLDFSRIGETERQDTNLRELVQVVIDMVKHLGQYRGKQIEFECDQHIVVAVNAQEIKQVVLNLVTNALDSLEKRGKVRVHLHRTNEHAKLTVEDDGIGMTEEVLAHLFEPFFTRRRGGHGTGLGLSITYRIVTDHGGRISVASDGPGTGSRFTVLLPLMHHEKETQNKRRAA
jgi:signal transduction histidine kinase